MWWARSSQETQLPSEAARSASRCLLLLDGERTAVMLHPRGSCTSRAG